VRLEREGNVSQDNGPDGNHNMLFWILIGVIFLGLLLITMANLGRGQ
jgi:hypothetical protein